MLFILLLSYNLEEILDFLVHYSDVALTVTYSIVACDQNIVYQSILHHRGNHENM